MDKIED